MHQSGLHFVTDVGLTLDVILDGVTARSTWTDGAVASAQAKMVADFMAENVWGPGVVIETCREKLPRDTVATVDSGAHRVCCRKSGSVLNLAVCCNHRHFARWAAPSLC